MHEDIRSALAELFLFNDKRNKKNESSRESSKHKRLAGTQLGRFGPDG